MPARTSPRPPSGLAVILDSQDLTAARDFYARELGLVLVVDEPTRLAFRLGGAWLELRQREGPPSGHEGVRLSLRCEDVAGLARRLQSLGVEVDVPPGGVASGFRARDPDGRWLAFAPTAPAAGPQ